MIIALAIGRHAFNTRTVAISAEGDRITCLSMKITSTGLFESGT